MTRRFGKVPNVKFRWGMLDVVDFWVGCLDVVGWGGDEHDNPREEEQKSYMCGYIT